MSKQKIVVIPNNHYDLDYFGCNDFDSVEDLNKWAKTVAGKMDLKNGVRIIVGEERCLEEIQSGSSIQYRLSGAGCDCHKKENQHDPKAWDLKHGIIQEF